MRRAHFLPALFLQALLLFGANPGLQLIDAARRCQPARVRRLLKMGAMVNVKDGAGFSPLHYCALNGCTSVAEILLSHGANPNEPKGVPPFANPNQVMDTARRLQMDDIFYVLRLQDGSTPLHWAAMVGRIKMGKLLLKYHANRNARDRDGNTPLHWAAYFRQTEFGKFLLDRGANIRALNRRGITALHMAAVSGSADFARMLFERGRIDPNAQDEFGNSPLHYAAYHSHKEVAEVLFRSGADVNIMNRKGCTPMDYAFKPEMVQFLKSAGGRRHCRMGKKRLEELKKMLRH